MVRRDLSHMTRSCLHSSVNGCIKNLDPSRAVDALILFEQRNVETDGIKASKYSREDEQGHSSHGRAKRHCLRQEGNVDLKEGLEASDSCGCRSQLQQEWRYFLQQLENV